MNWHNYKEEKPKNYSRCLVEFEKKEYSILSAYEFKYSYRVAMYYNVKYYNRKTSCVWRIGVGDCISDNDVTRWAYLDDITDNAKITLKE